MNGNSGKITRADRPDRTPEGHGIRLQLVLPIGAVVFLLGYLALRPAKPLPDSVLPGEPVAASRPLAIVVPKRHVGTGAARETPVREPTPIPSVSTVPAQSLAKPEGSALVAQGLVTRLAQPEFFSGGITPQKAEELKRSFKELAEQG